MARCMDHWNGNMLCCIDIETTGLDPELHEIVQLCVLPLDSNIQPIQDIMPFYINIAPENPHTADYKAMHINKIDLVEITTRGFNTEKAKDLFYEWFDNLGLPYTKWGNRARIIPLGQNYAFDMSFIKRWLGPVGYDDVFHPQYRDTMLAATYLNDRAAMHANRVPYSKVNLTWLASAYYIEYSRKHDALSDCMTTAQVYRKMVQEGLLA